MSIYTYVTVALIMQLIDFLWSYDAKEEIDVVPSVVLSLLWPLTLPTLIVAIYLKQKKELK